MGETLVPGFNESEDIFAKLVNREEVTVLEAFAFENAEPDLYHVHPGGMEGDEVNNNAFILRLQPLAALGTGFQWRVLRAA